MIEAHYFDGRSARGQRVALRLEDDQLCAQPLPQGEALRWPLAQVVWPERTRHGQRVVQLRGGGSLQVADALAFDAWLREGGVAESWVVRAQQSWRGVLVSALALLVLVVAGYRWGLPAAAQVVVKAIPQTVDRRMGDSALAQLQPLVLKPSNLPAQRQAALQAAFAKAVAAAYPAGGEEGAAPDYTVRFMAAAKMMGPNAMALPGGTIIVTDALVELLDGQDDAVLGVMAHELGHVRHRHGMRALVQVTLLGAVGSLVLGDFSTLVAGLPVLMGQMAYSRDAERESDQEAARVLLAAGKSPETMVVFFERVRALQSQAPKRAGEAGKGGDGGAEKRGDQGADQGAERPTSARLPIALASHPVDEARIEFFRNAARGR